MSRLYGGEPFAETRVNLGVVEEGEVVRPADVVAVFLAEGDFACFALPPGAGREYEDVAEERSERVVVADSYGGGDEVVRRAWQQGDFVAGHGKERVVIAPLPVLVY